MRIWAISDTHFNHANIIKYCNRPFESVEEMNLELMECWNNTIDTNDIVIHCGDIALGKAEDAALLEFLNGRIILIRGNHDRLSTSKYLEHGIQRVFDKPLFLGTCVFMHHPNMDLYRSKGGSALKWYYGHVHDKPCEFDALPTTTCVCVDRTNFYPIDITAQLNEREIEKLEEIINGRID